MEESKRREYRSKFCNRPFCLKGNGTLHPFCHMHGEQQGDKRRHIKKIYLAALMRSKRNDPIPWIQHKQKTVSALSFNNNNCTNILPEKYLKWISKRKNVENWVNYIYV